LTPVIPPYRRGGGFGSLGVRFKEVFEPPAISFAPATLGAWLSIAVLVLVLLAGTVWLAWRYGRRRHRREALRELSALSAVWLQKHERVALEAVPPLLKRCALQSFERSKVASLSGERWVAFLTLTGPAPFGDAAARALLAITTRGASAVDAANAPSLFASSRIWIRRHRAEL
jgi:hypothetical protein